MSKVELTEEKLAELGHELSNIESMMRMVTNMADVLLWVSAKDREIYAHNSKEFLDTFHDQFMIAREVINEIAFLLLNAANKDELEASKAIKQGG